MKEQIRAALQAFATGTLAHNALHLFETLGYRTSRRFALGQPTYAGFAADFPGAADRLNHDRAYVGHWESIDLLFQLTAEEMRETDPLFQPTVERTEPASYLFFCIELRNGNWTQNQLAQIVREINKGFGMHVFVLFKFGNQLSLSLIDRRPNKKIMDRDVLETVTHVHCIRIADPHTAHLQILYTFSLKSLINESKRKRIENFADLQAGWRKVLSTQVLNKQFYLDYQSLSKKLIRAVHPQQQTDKLLTHQGVLNLLNRLMFVFFVQKKRWINDDDNFLSHFWRDYQFHRETSTATETSSLGNSATDTTFHEHWLNTLFFYAFNGRMQGAFASLPYLPETYQRALIQSPYLNGGLFARNEDLDTFLLPDALFTDIFTYFEGYIFTISEGTPLDVNLEINPELLGKMYEGMINATDLDDVDAENGIVYTERPEINFMVRRSLVEVLDKKLNPESGPRRFSREFLYHFVFDEPAQKQEIIRRYKADPDLLRQAVASVTACDPSCGSGSMLLGVIQVQMEIIRTLDEYTGRLHTGRDDFQIKKQLISECIYGVDIKEWAVRIAELRLWLYMIAEADFAASELTRFPLLPNLDFKLRQGNSLLQKFGNMDFTAKALFSGRRRNMGAAKQLNDFIKRKKAYITNQEESGTTYKKLKAEEFAVFQRFITELIEENVRKIKDIKRGVGGYAPQGQLFGDVQPEQATIAFNEAEINALQDEIETLQALRQTILTQGRLPFSYDIDFMEVFLVPDDPGFDLIIGNPPYVKEKDILPPEDGQYLEYLLQLENKDERARVNKAYKKAINNKIYRTYPFLSATIRTRVNGKNKITDVYGQKLPGKSDLYSYFQILCPNYLNQKGIFCFIISNSWLDVDFGCYTQQFLLKHTRLYGIYDCHIRSFDAAINTIIYIHSALINTSNILDRSSNGMTRDNRKIDFKTLLPSSDPVHFIMNRVDFSLASYSPLLLEQEHNTGNNFHELYRSITTNQDVLYKVGFNESTNEYSGLKWFGSFYKASEIYIKLNKDARFKPLIHFGKIKLGITSCQNDFFYPDDKLISLFKIESNYLKPIFKSPQDSKHILNQPHILPNRVLICNDEVLHDNGIKSYVRYGENKNYDRVSCLKGRRIWYSLGSPEESRIIIPYSYGDSFKTFYSTEKCIVDKRLLFLQFNFVY